jgi:hypothetical protein
LGEIIIRMSNGVSLDKTINLVGLLGELLVISVVALRVGFVVSSGTLVSVDRHETVSLSIDDSASVRAVDGDLLVVDSQSVSVGISIGEESTLQHLIVGGFNTRNEMTRGESSLFDFSKIVFGVLVQNHLTYFDQRVVRMRPDLGNIEDVPLVLGAISFGHNLNLKGPSGGLSRSNMVEKILGGIIGIR